MFNKDVMFSSKSSDWETPQDIFDELDETFGFTLDPCATNETAKCDQYYTMKENGLERSWKGHNVFMNPPYGRKIEKWIKKAYTEALETNTLVVCLLPSRTDTRWFHKYCIQGTIWFIKGRLKFGGCKNSAPFPSMIVIFGEGYWNPYMQMKKIREYPVRFPQIYCLGCGEEMKQAKGKINTKWYCENPDCDVIYLVFNFRYNSVKTIIRESQRIMNT